MNEADFRPIQLFLGVLSKSNFTKSSKKKKKNIIGETIMNYVQLGRENQNAQ